MAQTTIPVGDKDEMAHRAMAVIHSIEAGGANLIRNYREYSRSTKYLPYPDYLEFGERFKDLLVLGCFTTPLVEELKQFVQDTLQ
jgi:hypothetical protein